MNPGDLCRIITDANGKATSVKHVAPCSQAGKFTDVRTGRVLDHREDHR